MMTEIIANPHWFWLTVGGVLLVTEMLGTNGYLLWSGIASLATGLISWMLPIPWPWQGILFALLTLISAFLWFRWTKWQTSRQTHIVLNQREHQMIGVTLTLDTALHNGLGHVKIGDSSWRVQADSDLPAGTKVTIERIEGITLRIIQKPD